MISVLIKVAGDERAGNLKIVAEKIKNIMTNLSSLGTGANVPLGEHKSRNVSERPCHIHIHSSFTNVSTEERTVSLTLSNDSDGITRYLNKLL